MIEMIITCIIIVVVMWVLCIRFLRSIIHMTEEGSPPFTTFSIILKVRGVLDLPGVLHDI